ncbi:MAG: hypothetical protein WBG37_06885 [Desulfobacterales bacterium]
MGHNHPHGHHHHHSHDTDSELSFPQKLQKLLDHWIHHNEDHAHTYRQWAERCREQDLEALAQALEQVAQTNLKINEEMEAARKLIPRG